MPSTYFNYVALSLVDALISPLPPPSLWSPSAKMVLPGWNVSEPIDLAYKLYQVVESLRSAPETAKAFVSKIDNFSANLKELQKIPESDTPTHSAQDLEHLRDTVLKCQACVKRCEEFGEGFRKLTTDGNGRIHSAGQAARWALQEKKVARLREEIDDCMKGVTLSLLVKTLWVGLASKYYADQTNERQCRWSYQAGLSAGDGKHRISSSNWNLCQLTFIFLFSIQLGPNRRSPTA